MIETLASLNGYALTVERYEDEGFDKHTWNIHTPNGGCYEIEGTSSYSAFSEATEAFYAAIEACELSNSIRS
jgi:hypothetical protein